MAKNRRKPRVLYMVFSCYNHEEGYRGTRKEAEELKREIEEWGDYLRPITIAKYVLATKKGDRR